MDDWNTTLTSAQRESYWESIRGTRVTWPGELIDASTEGSGLIGLRCNPRSGGADVAVKLDGSQRDTLPSLQKGDLLAVEGTIESHSTAGYLLVDGRIVPFKPKPGPNFMDVDLVMDDQRSFGSSPEKEAYWRSVWRSQVRWTGFLQSVPVPGSRTLELHCHPGKEGTDVVVQLLPDERTDDPRLKLGEFVTVAAILESHDLSGYQLRNGRIVAYPSRLH